MPKLTERQRAVESCRRLMMVSCSIGDIAKKIGATVTQVSYYISSRIKAKKVYTFKEGAP